MALALLLLCAVLLPAVSAWAETTAPRELPWTAVHFADGFWAPKQAIYRDRTIPHSWQYVAAEVEDNEIAAGWKKLPRGDSTPWNQANLHKVLETCGYALGQAPNAELDHRVDGIIAALAAAQRPDGYLNATLQVRGIAPWSWLDGRHEGYVAGHLIEAAVAHFQGTGKTSLLDVARRNADAIYRLFITEGHAGVCGHAELELALCRLYRATGERRYLDLAREWIERRGKPWHYDSPTPRAYFMDHRPIREVPEVTGHAVRTLFYLTGVADVAAETADPGLAQAATRLYQDIVLRKIYVTGAVGTQEQDEGFGPAYELPNEGGYGESCAACGMVYFSARMFYLTGEAGAIDTLERTLYNAVLHGLSLDGCSSYYRNPVHDAKRPRDNCWVCCPPCLSRTLLRVQDWVYARADHDLWVNLYVAGQAEATLSGVRVGLKQTTDYPWDGRIALTLAPAQPVAAKLHLRVPGWAGSFELRLNGQGVAQPPLDHGYAVLDRTWQAGDTVELRLPMPVERVEADPRVQACRGRVALMRGPLVYALEGVDNPATTTPRLAPGDPGFTTTWRPDLLGGVTAIGFTSADQTQHVAVPYYALANRELSRQMVWLEQNDKVSPAAWDGGLYRPWRGR